MYGVPKDLPLDFFINAYVENVCFGPYIAHFDFSSHEPNKKISEAIRLSVEGKCELVDQLGHIAASHIDITKSFALTPLARNLALLAGGTVTGYELHDPLFFTLHIEAKHLDGKYKFSVFDSSKQYESFQIRFRSMTFIV